MSPDLARRQKIAEDTKARSDVITIEHAKEGATTESMFLTADQLPALDVSDCPNLPSSKIRVVNADSFTTARDIMKTDPEARGKTAVQNLASDEMPGGGWESSLSKTQEEALCYSSTLFATLKPSYYPWDNLGPKSIAGVFSPGVVVFKDDLDHDCINLVPNERRVVSVITVAAPRCPALSEDRSTFRNISDLEDFRGKIRLVYRMAAHHGQQYLVLSAMGCGAYDCPPRLVAEEMKAGLSEPEFKGWFRRVTFAVYSKKSNGPRNFDIFQELLDGVEI